MAQQQAGVGMVAGGGGLGASSSQFGDTTLTKVFVGGLAWETQRETMRRYFEQFGEILEAVVITDKHTGRSKGYGFVTFRDPEAARRACADPSPVIDGRRANCNLASLGSQRPRPSVPYGSRFRPSSPYPGWSQGGGHGYGAGTAFAQPVPYAYQQGFPYSPYGYSQYPSEYTYPSSIYNPYVTPQLQPVYTGPGTVGSPTLYPYPLGQSLQGAPGFPVQGYGTQAPQLLPYGSPGVSPMTSLPQYGGIVPIPSPVQSAGPVPSPPQFVVPTPSQQHFTPGGGDPEQPSG